MSFIIISCVFLLGLIIGSFSVYACETNDYYGINTYFNGYIESIRESEFLKIFFDTLFVFFLIVFLNFILGLCVVGNFFSFLFYFLFSYGIGAVSGFFYSAYHLKGIGFFALNILPALFLFLIDYIISLKHSIAFSNRLFKLCCVNKEVKVDFKAYLIKFIVHFVLVAIISLIYAFFIKTFNVMFDFS